MGDGWPEAIVLTPGWIDQNQVAGGGQGLEGGSRAQGVLEQLELGGSLGVPDRQEDLRSPLGHGPGLAAGVPGRELPDEEARSLGRELETGGELGAREAEHEGSPALDAPVGAGFGGQPRLGRQGQKARPLGPGEELDLGVRLVVQLAGEPAGEAHRVALDETGPQLAQVLEAARSAPVGEGVMHVGAGAANVTPMDYPLHAGFVLVYLLVLVGVGAMKARKITDQEGFALAGRGLPTFVLIGTLLATWIGTGSIMGNAQKTYEVGVPALLLPIAGGLGILALYLLAQRIRTFEQFTIQDILEARFGVGARLLATVALLGAYIIIVSYQYRTGAVVLSYVIPSLTETQATIAVALFVIAYTALAGMYSVAYTDVANGILMAIGVAIALPLLLADAGGWSAAIAALPEGTREVTDHWSILKLLGVLLPPFLLIIGDANMYQRFFSAKSPQAARKSAIGMFFGVIVMEVVIIAVALVASALVAQGKLTAPGKPAHIIIHAAFEALPTFVGALLVGTAVAIVVSTADSYLLSPATSVVRDIYQRFINPEAEGTKVVTISRVCVVVLGLIALGLAFTSDDFFEVALFAYTIYGCAITPALLAAFFWKRANQAGAVASIFTGGGVALLWDSVNFFRARDAGWAEGVADALTVGGLDVIGEIDAVMVAFPLSVIALVVVSLGTGAPTQEQSRSI